MRQREDVGALRHEMDAAEDDVIGLWMFGDGVGELERIAGVVGEADHFVALIVMAEDHQPVAERGLRRLDAERHLLVRQPEIGLRKRLSLADRRLLDFVQDGKECAHLLSLLVKLFSIYRREKTKRDVRYC